MIVVTGNWLISDGSLFPPPARGAIEPLFGEIARLACVAGVGDDGRYRPIERIDIVLAGDTFDGLTSRRWIGRVRPWHSGTPRREAAELVLSDAIRLGRRPLSRLATLARRGVRVPAADRRQRPVLDQFVPVSVGVTLLPGDRDGVLERPLAAVADRHGFGIGSCWERLEGGEANVLIRHGHEFDPLCGTAADEPAGFGRRPSVSESLAVEWLAVFAARLEDTPCPPPFARRLVRDVAVGPWTSAPAILRRHLVDASLPASTEATVIDAWSRSIDRWHAATAADPPGFATGFDTPAAIASWMERVDLRRRGEPCDGLLGPCADGWLDIRRRDLVASVPRTCVAVLGHPPRRLSDGTVVTLGPASEGDGEAVDSLVADRRPVVEIDAAKRPPSTPAWVAIPRPDGNGGIVESGDWTRAAA